MSTVVLAVAACAIAHAAAAQGVPAQREPHHHPVFEDAAFRVLRVEVPAHDTTLMHRHDPDYFWIALDASDIVNAKYGEPAVRVLAAASSLHFTNGGFSHVARVPGDRPFRNVTVELFTPQSGARNLCEPVLEGQPLDCVDGGKAASDAAGSKVKPSFRTDQLRVSLVTVEPLGTLRGAGARVPALVFTTDGKAAAGLEIRSAGTAAVWAGGVFRARSGERWEVRNGGTDAVLLVLAEPLG